MKKHGVKNHSEKQPVEKQPVEKKLTEKQRNRLYLVMILALIATALVLYWVSADRDAGRDADPRAVSGAIRHTVYASASPSPSAALLPSSGNERSA